MGDVHNGGNYASVSVVGIGDISVPFPKFCCKPYTALKNNKAIMIIILKPYSNTVLFTPACISYLLFHMFFLLHIVFI